MSKPLSEKFMSHKESALRHIEAAIHSARSDDYDLAITLAAAAEGQLPATDKPYIYKDIRADKESAGIDLNAVINWLKHPLKPDEMLITDFEVAVTILRAISKFVAVYGKISGTMNDFDSWARSYYFKPRDAANSPSTSG